eukprot:11103713-Alexandrium_andersonii.AAC.1
MPTWPTFKARQCCKAAAYEYFPTASCKRAWIALGSQGPIVAMGLNRAVVAPAFEARAAAEG